MKTKQALLAAVAAPLAVLAVAPAVLPDPDAPAPAPAPPEPTVRAAPNPVADARALADLCSMSHDVFGLFVQGRAAGGRTDEELFEALRLVVEREDLALGMPSGWKVGDANPFAEPGDVPDEARTRWLLRYVRGNAAGCMRFLSATNAFDYLGNLVVAEADDPLDDALYGLVDMAFRGVANLPKFNALLDDPRSRKVRPAFYGETGRLAAGAPPESQRRERILRFLVERVPVETEASGSLDMVLCRTLPAWRESPQRAANAERILAGCGDHPGLSNYFARVRAEAPDEAVRRIPEIDPFDPFADLFRRPGP